MRTLADIGAKIDKVIPAFTHFDAATAVVFVCLAAGVITALSHTAPNIIESGSFLFITTGITMTKPRWLGILNTIAEITLAISKNSRRYDSDISAITSARPQVAACTVVFVARPLDCCQSAKALIGDILWLAHRTASNGLREVAGSMLKAPIPLRIIA